VGDGNNEGIGRVCGGEFRKIDCFEKKILNRLNKWGILDKHRKCNIFVCKIHIITISNHTATLRRRKKFFYPKNEI
jgi:hypothetical protein